MTSEHSYRNEIDDVVLVRMAHERDELADIDLDAEAMQQLALERLLVRLARLRRDRRETPT